VTARSDYRQIFDARGGAYNAAHALAPAARATERALLLDRLALAPGLTLLDVPAGGGYVADGVRGREPTVTVVCVEPSRPFAAGIAPSYLRVRAAPDRLALRSASLDRVASLAGMHHLADRAAFLRECRRVLAPGGRIALADASCDGAVAAFLNGPVDRYTTTGHQGRFFARGEAAALLAAAGFADVDEAQVDYSWDFQDLPTLVRFCGTIFGLERADAATVERALRDHFVLEVDEAGARLPWSLVYARGTAA
jgi:SAM-dependent methyltransferase